MMGISKEVARALRTDPTLGSSPEMAHRWKAMFEHPESQLSDTMREIEGNSGTEPLTLDALRERFAVLRDAPVRVSGQESSRNTPQGSQQCESGQIESLSDERLAEIEALADVRCTVAGCPCIADAFLELIAEVRRLRFDQEWVKVAVTSNRDVCEPCAAEIKRAVGWSDA